MKFLDQQGKLFGIINPIDLGVIMLLLFLGIKVLADFRPAPLNLKERPIEMGLLVRDTPPYLANSVVVGQDLFQDNTQSYLGKIYTKRTNPSEIILNNNGALVLSKSPRNVDLRVIVRRKARIVTGPARGGVYLGKLVVHVGDRIQSHTLYSSVNAEVEYLKVNP